ncbi:MAG TPA: mechanosensitive ion channel family protein, partial [Actinomycetota bacterium]|nr:mechanosensitive ion channel family protein [Actinomycetota bacterium]
AMHRARSPTSYPSAYPGGPHGFLALTIPRLLGPHGLGESALRWSLSHGVRIVIIVVSTYLLSRAGHRLLARLEQRLRTEDAQAGRSPARSKTLAEVSRSVVTMVAWVIAAMLVLGELGLNLTPLIASASVVGVALGFGAQSLVRDFLTGFFVLFEDQYAIGDVVEIGQVTGTVERFTLRMTSLRSEDGTLHNIANGTIQRVSNSSAGWARAVVDVGVALEADLTQVREAFTVAGEALMADEEVSSLVLEAPSILGAQAMTESQVTIRVAIKTVPGGRATVARAYRHQVKDVLERSKIPISSPASMLIVQSDGKVISTFPGGNGSASPNGSAD